MADTATPETFDPRIGDLWQDHDGHLWFVCANENEEFYVDLVCETGQRATPQHVGRYCGPLSLWHRAYIEEAS